MIVAVVMGMAVVILVGVGMGLVVFVGMAVVMLMGVGVTRLALPHTVEVIGSMIVGVAGRPRHAVAASDIEGSGGGIRRRRRHEDVIT